MGYEKSRAHMVCQASSYGQCANSLNLSTKMEQLSNGFQKYGTVREGGHPLSSGRNQREVISSNSNSTHVTCP